MKSRLLVALPALAFVSVLPLTAAAQQPQLRPTHDKQYKVKAKGEVERIRDKSKPVRAALEEQYARIAAAYRDSTPDVILNLRTPDFAVQPPNGERWNAERSAGYIRAAFQQVERTLGVSFTIRELNVRGDTAAALIHQEWSRIQRMGGQLRHVETSACQRETWVNTTEGWRLQFIDNVQPLVWEVDGKRVDPSQPFDPEAPPFAPDVEVVSRCTNEGSGNT